MGKKCQLPTGDGASRDRVVGKMRKCTRKVARRWIREENELADLILQIRYRRTQELKSVYENVEAHGDLGYEDLEDLLTCFGQDCISSYGVMLFVDEETFSGILEFNKSELAGDWRITWEHVVALSRCLNAESQRSVLTQCMDKRLSVEQLKRLVGASRRSNQKVGANKSHEVDSQPVAS